MPTIKKRVTNRRKHQPEEEIRSILHTVSEYITEYKKLSIIAAVVILTVVVALSAYAVIQSSKDSKAAQLLPAAHELYSPTGGMQPDYQKALERYQDIAKNYSGTMNGAVAQYYAGNCLANLGRSEEALKEYRTFINEYSGKKFLLGLVNQRMGLVYVSLGKQAEAVKAFGQAESLLGPGLSTMELAKLYERAGNPAESQKKYKEIAEKLPSTMWAMEARTKLPPPNLTAPPAPAATAAQGGVSK